MKHCHIKGLGHYLPKKILSNHDLEKMVDTSDEWIRQRTGIQTRHIADDGELPSDMGLKATKQALKDSALKVKDIDMIIVATVFPDQLLPNTACELQKKLGISEIPAFDISSACSGFVYAFSIASQYIQSGMYKNVLVVGTEILHHVTNYKDRGTCILFGDGAGAFVLSASPDPKKGCVYHQELKTYGELGHLLYIPAPGAKAISKNQTEKQATYIHMDGQKVFKNAVQIICSAYQKTLKDTNRKPEQIDWVVPHQANERILKKFSEVTGFPEQKIIFDIQDTGNTSSASIPVAFSRAVKKGKIKRGQSVLMVAVGGGLSSGSILIRY